MLLHSSLSLVKRNHRCDEFPNRMHVALENVKYSLSSKSLPALNKPCSDCVHLLGLQKSTHPAVEVQVAAGKS